MNPGSTKTFYQARKALLILACASPVLVLGVVWWVVTQVLMVPGVPDGTTPPEQVAQFIMHEKGLPRLGRAQGEAFFRRQVRRLGRDQAFRERFLAELRTAGSVEQKAFRAHLFDVFKPLLMKDIEQYHALAGAARREYLDERIVEYNRMSRALGKAGISAEALDAVAPDQTEMLTLLMEKTTEQERQLGMAYGAAIAARVAEILADPELKAEFEARISSPEP
ncbi:MAG: hypothetical protein KAY37_02140 [Phycisphaerae bacterium]|nr:hypothetical protein [Phycisphaerae bacterium]